MADVDIWCMIEISLSTTALISMSPTFIMSVPVFLVVSLVLFILPVFDVCFHVGYCFSSMDVAV